MKPEDFAALMQKQLDANTHKGDWTTYKPSEDAVINDLELHVNKLCHAVVGRNTKRQQYAANVANICMKIAEQSHTPFVHDGE